MEPLQTRKLVDGNCSVGSLGSAIYLFFFPVPVLLLLLFLLAFLGCGICGGCEEEFVEWVGVMIRLYVMRISEGMGKGGPGRGILGRCHADPLTFVL